MDEHQLDCMIKHIEYMSNSLGNNKTTKDLDVPKDDFEKARLTFKVLVTKFEQNTKKLASGYKLQRIQKIELEEELHDVKRQMQKELKYMINHCDLKEKQLSKATGKRNPNKQRIQKLTGEVNYKKLQCLNCQKTYALLCGSGGEQKVKVITLADLKLKQDIKEPLVDDEDDEENQDQRFLMARIKAIDELIESEMDQILDKIQIFKKHAISIGDALDITHKQIVLNMKIMTTNKKELETSNLKLKKILKHWTRPNCCLDVILILLLLVLAYLIIRQFT